MRFAFSVVLLAGAACARPVDHSEAQQPKPPATPTEEQCRADEALCEPWIGREGCSIATCEAACLVDAGTADACLACIRVVTHECEDRKAAGERACERLRACPKR